MRANPAFTKPITSRIIIRDFDAPVNVSENYIQRLTSYLQVPESGNYTFYMACDDFCELWKHDVRETGIEGGHDKPGESVTQEPIVSIKTWTGYQQWGRSKGEMSRAMFLSKCHLYRLEAFMKEGIREDHVSVGMRTPDGEYERPITASRLYWVNPGNRTLEITLQHQDKSIPAFVGSRVLISGFYQFCCEGVHCPDCPLDLSISTLEQNVSLNSALNHSCTNTSYTAGFNTDKQPGNFTIKVRYGFVNNSGNKMNERTIGHLHLQAVLLQECHFTSGLCAGWTSLGDQKTKWKMSTEKPFIMYPGHFVYLGSPNKARVESPLLPWQPFHQSVGVCLRFYFLMPNKTTSTLKVLLTNLQREETLVWQLTGYHGTEWSAAQVSWAGVAGNKIIFEGEGLLNEVINVAIDDVTVTTEHCSLRPYFAKPGFSCGSNQFQCDNGECIKKNLICDGDFGCKDGSDEKNCKCPINMFSCSDGGCLLATVVCDGKQDCTNGEDENNCRNACPSNHQCLDGSCIPWSETCKQTSYCRDGTNTPLVCGSGKCRLSDLACSSNITSGETRCRSFRGYCGFQNDLCGFKLDNEAAFHWTVGSGPTPTEDTGPSYDHTSFSKEGSYLFIEASQKSPGEKARLLSGWMEANETVCVQFWYHMYGINIGSLSVYLKTNQSETLVWRQSGDKGNRWRFGQTALQSLSFYKIVLEGTTGDGIKGDIAVDDLAVLDEGCKTVKLQTSPDCYFEEEDKCNWKAQKEWALDSSLEGVEKAGGFVSLPSGASDHPSVISSPVINTNGYEWKCVRFWFFIRGDHVSLTVNITKPTNNETRQIFFADKAGSKWQFVQIPINSSHGSSQIDFIGLNKFNGETKLAIDDVSFTKEKCERIPWNPDEGYQLCDISKEWCGWKSLGGWERSKYRDTNLSHHEFDTTDLVTDPPYDHPGNLPLNSYQLRLPNRNLGYISFSDMSPLEVGFTLCFWLKTKYAGFFTEYKVISEENEVIAVGVYCRLDNISVIINGKRSDISVGVADDTWHHVCLSWTAVGGRGEIFKDGELKEWLPGFTKRPDPGIQGGGTMTIGFRTTLQNTTVSLGDLSGFNVWSHPLKAEEILRMSQGCGSESGDAKAWRSVSQGINKEVEVTWTRSCTDRKADRLVVAHNATLSNNSAALMSPLYNRSRDWYRKCLKFRYMLNGTGKKQMTIYQKAGKYQEIPVWTWRNNTGKLWRYGEVPLSSVTEFKVVIKGDVQTDQDSISLTALYIEKATHCKHQPPEAKYACNEVFSNTSGYLFSPSFPGFPLPDAFCTWLIDVPSGHRIRLEFREFRLQDHPTCDKCFLQVFDGRDETAPAIGKFCGSTYPPVFVSSSNRFFVVLRCHGIQAATRFKAYYQSLRDYNSKSPSCLRQQGCPSSCKCSVFGNEEDGKLLVKGEDLLSVPSNLPYNTGAVIFRKNRISQMREGDFYDLTKLEYIDMSFNILLHLDEDSFRNVSSVETLRLNSNFFRTLPDGGFRGLSKLRVLDLGKNLLSKATKGMLSGISSLQVLSLRYNQITELKGGLFNSTHNLTFLYLQNNKIQTLPEGLFDALANLKLLDLSNNELTTIAKSTFRGMRSLEFLYLDNNKLSDVPPDVFSGLKNLKYVKLDRFILCCYAKKSITGVSCDSPVDEFSSCDDLMKNNTLQICIWILGILALFGNMLVIIWRVLDREENRVHSFLLTNLAAADLLMGVYLLTIAVMDVRWQGEYFKHDVAWRSGIGCQAVGALSMLSSEVSVPILTVITTDRLICIVFPFKFKRLTFKTAVITCAGVWMFGILISAIPIFGISYFYDETGQYGFYSRSAVCLPLQLSEGTPAGWQYSVSFFVGLNFISFTFILFAYIAMLCTVKHVSRAVRSTNLNRESAMAKRLVFIVMTDFCCWMPIIIINILSLTGNFNDPQKIAYVWIAVFVLPLNSSINPILYTFSTARAKRSFDRKRRNINQVIMKTFHSNIPGRKRAVEWQEPNQLESVVSDDLTLITNVIPSTSPQPISRPMETQEQESRTVHAKLNVIEEPDILQDDCTTTAGYLVAWCEEEDSLCMVLLKYFGKESKEDWIRETDIVKSLSDVGEPQPNILKYRWHSKARDQSIELGKVKIRAFKETSLLICYDFVSSSTLENFLGESGTVINFDTVCAIAVDVICAIERLEHLGLRHNNVTTKNILIGHCQRLPPIRAVLGGFSKASKRTEGAYTNWGCAEQSNHSNDVEQFGKLMAILLGHCHGSSEYVKLHEIMKLCFEEKEEKRHKAFHIRELLEDAWCTQGIWDTCL